jgi:hypothetical protein
MKTKTGTLAPTNMRSGGGYISSLSRLKASAIKTPLKYYHVWNTLVNECDSIEQLNNLIKSDKSENSNLNK